MQIIKDSKIDFINKSRFTILLSGALILAGIFSIVINNGPRLSIDFKGGTLIAVQYAKSININSFAVAFKASNTTNGCTPTCLVILSSSCAYHVLIRVVYIYIGKTLIGALCPVSRLV